MKESGRPNEIESLTIGDRNDEIAATVALIRSEVVRGAYLGGLIDEVGSAVRLVQFSESDRLFASPNASHDVIGAVTNEDIRRARVDAAQWNTRGLDVRSVLDASYPSELHEIFNRPPLLFVQGNLPAAAPNPSVAVVGTRKPTDDGIRRAGRLATDLVEAGVTVLSGLAAGIDTAAHTAALLALGSTRAVVGTGLSRIYPAENEDLARKIVASGGALISQFFPNQPPTRWTFPMRNVVMSGLSMATVVVEAGETSGARMQARVALQHGRAVFLLRSLVKEHEWAAKYVEEGAYGTHAIEIASTKDILDRLRNPVPPGATLAVA